MRSFWLEYGGRRFGLRQGESTVGRSPYSSIVVENSLASRHHAAFRVTGNMLEVVDLRSRNGTFVNGERISKPVQLRIGDRVTIGDEDLTVLGAAGARGSKTETQDKLEVHPGADSGRPTQEPGTFDEATRDR